MASSTTKEPCRCKWCFRPNRMSALRCGTCDELWHHCLDKTFVPDGREKQSKQSKPWTYTGWKEQGDGQEDPARRVTKSPRAQSAEKDKSPRSRRGKKQEESLVPALELQTDRQCTICDFHECKFLSSGKSTSSFGLRVEEEACTSLSRRDCSADFGNN